MAGAERFHLKPDPVIDFEVPHDGEYVVEIHDSIFRGREDFVYRLTIGELPYVTSVFPLGGRAGETTSVVLTGWNLKQTALTHENGKQTGIASLIGEFFNSVSFIIDDLPECPAEGSNGSVENAQPVTVPTIVNGHIGRAGECSVFKFAGRKGQSIVAEVMARRLDSPMDSFLRLTDANGKQLAFNDDFEDKASGLETHHADSYLSASLPDDGQYFICIGDTQGKGGPDFAYRLRISETRPDFSLRVVPSSLSLRAGMSTPVTVYALRKDGFTNAIDIHLADGFQGFSLSGARVAENQEKVQFTLKAPPQGGGRITNIELAGTAVINGQTVTHAAVPAEDMMQAFAYRHLVPSKELLVAITPNPRPFAASAIKVVSVTPVEIPAGGVARVRITTPSPMFVDRFRLDLNGAPEGITMTNIAPVENGIELVIAADNDKIKAGASGNLIINISPRNPAPGANQKAPVDPARRPAAPTLSAIPFQVVAAKL